MAQFGPTNEKIVQVTFCPTTLVQLHWLHLHLQAQTKGGTCVSPETGSINNFLFLPKQRYSIKRQRSIHMLDFSACSLQYAFTHQSEFISPNKLEIMEVKHIL